MAVIIGGSGSTGSSLFKNLLNNHPDIFGGIETSLFAKKSLYNNWNLNKWRITHRSWRGLPNHSWHYYRGVDLLHSEFGHNLGEIKKMIQKSKSFPDFSARFFSRALKENQASIWIEKTPSNAACFSHFLNAFPDGKVIHMTRNPYDTLSSLLSRGFDLWYALGIYLLNTSAALTHENNPAYFRVKYEDLVQDTESTLRNVCHFLEVNFHRDMLLPRKGVADFETKLRGWKFDETDSVKKGSIGRFEEMDKFLQKEIIQGFKAVYINSTGQNLCGNKLSCLENIIEILGYSLKTQSSSTAGSITSKLRNQRHSNRIFRLKKACPKGFFCPISIR
ncbi:MAG: sulfotransferase [Saprospirales bacterium]|nr:MAG: sulfotransferase [Saprospirales bacterium]